MPAADKSNFDHGGASAPARPGVEGRRGDGQRPCTAREIVEADADSVLALRGNQGVRAAFDLNYLANLLKL